MLDPDGLQKRKIIINPNRRTKSLARKRSSVQVNSNPKINFSFATQIESSRVWNVFATSKKPKITHQIPGVSQEIEGGGMDISAHSNLDNSAKRKIKRSFPRPSASSILGLDKEGPISMANTNSTNMNNVPIKTEVQLNVYSSIEASSLEHPQKMDAKMPPVFDAT